MQASGRLFLYYQALRAWLAVYAITPTLLCKVISWCNVLILVVEIREFCLDCTWCVNFQGIVLSFCCQCYYKIAVGYSPLIFQSINLPSFIISILLHLIKSHFLQKLNYGIIYYLMTKDSYFFSSISNIRLHFNNCIYKHVFYHFLSLYGVFLIPFALRVLTI